MYGTRLLRLFYRTLTRQAVSGLMHCFTEWNWLIYQGKNIHERKKDVKKHVRALADVAHIPAVQEKSELIDAILHTDYLDRAGIDELETIRQELRDLMDYVQKKSVRYDTNFTDDILDMKVNEPSLDYGELTNYKKSRILCPDTSGYGYYHQAEDQSAINGRRC